ncbi:MAG TPA: AEC family transporter [Hyphomonadaceae bacterium]|jgi:predicted permease|nr:AEC family transporter [Hyphomonadaceae bacterium]
MLDVVLSLVPVFSLIALGALLQRFKVLTVDGWSSLERLTYFVLFPPLMFMSIVNGSFASDEALWLGLAMAGTVVTMAALMLLARPVLAKDGPQFSSVFQAGIRWNGYVALGVAAGLYGEVGVGIAAIGFAVLVPVNNVMSVLVLSRYASEKPASFLRVIRSLLTNPLILSTLLAIILVSLGVRVSKPVGDTLTLLGDATVSLGLICVGAALDFSSMRSAKWPLAAGVLLRLVVMPGVAAGLSYTIGLSHMAFQIGMVCVTAPVATSAYILARQLGGDAKLMANIITLTTLLSLATIPITLWLTDMLF